MSFGLQNAPATFQRLVKQVVAHLDGCAVDLDDVVYSVTVLGSSHRINQLFTCLSQANLTVNLAKCEFARVTVTYLGKGFMRPMRAKFLAIDEYPPPTNKKELMQFLCMIGY